MQCDYQCERWVLKTPPHIAYLNDLLAQYPDAMLVWTHRDPIAVSKNIYRYYDLYLSEDAEIRMRDYLSKHPRNRYGEHTYKSQTFGLNNDTHKYLYERYSTRFQDYLI